MTKGNLWFPLEPGPLSLLAIPNQGGWVVLHGISMDVLALFPKLMVKSGHDAGAAGATAAAATATAAAGSFTVVVVK